MQITHGEAILTYFSTSSDSEFFLKYLEEHCSEIQVQQALGALAKLQVSEFILIKDFDVPFALRGQGIGRKMVNEFLSLNLGTSLMIAEAFGTNSINLKSWYEKLGYEQISTTSAGPLMCRIS